MRKILFTLLLAVTGSLLWAQNECAYTLEEAQDLFDAGQIETIPEKLSGCLETGFTREEVMQAYKLIILAHLFDDNIVEADKMMLAFLNIFPDYDPLATDPREFTALLESYDTDPVIMVGITAGPNFSLPVITDRSGTYNLNDYRGNYVPGGAGYQFGARVELPLADKLELCGELAFFSSRYDYYLDTEPTGSVFTGEITDWSLIEYYEGQNWLQVPLTVRYNFLKRKFTPYVNIGIVPGVLFRAIADGNRIYQNTGDVRYDPIPLLNIDEIRTIRRVFNLAASVGTGVKYDLGSGIFFMDIRFQAGLFNLYKPGSDRFINSLAYDLLYIPEDMILNNLAISVGYMLPIYNPKKKGE